MRLILLPLLLLSSACGERSADRDADGMVSSAEVTKEVAGVKMQPGRWETTIEVGAMSMPGVPAEMLEAVAPQKQTVSACLTKEQVENPKPTQFTLNKDAKCTHQRFTMRGGKLDSLMKCTPEGMGGTATTTMTGTYDRTRYDFAMTTDTDIPAAPDMKLKAKVTGRRTGDCTGSEAA